MYHTSDVKEFMNHSFNMSAQTKNTYDDWIKAFKESVKKRAEDGCFMGLSSGYDSGAVMNELNKLGIKYRAYSIFNNENAEVLKKRIDMVDDCVVTEMTKEEHDYYFNFLKSKKLSKEILDDVGSVGLAKMFDTASKEGRKVCIVNQGSDEIIADYALYHNQSTFKGKFPNELYEWDNFKHGKQEEYIKQLEEISALYGIECRYIFLDIDLVQEFLYLTPELKNRHYKAPLHEYLTINNIPFEEGKKRGFNPIYNMKVFILTDGQGWVVDRNTDTLIEGLRGRVDFHRREYTRISPEEFEQLGRHYDIVHYQNWDIAKFMDYLPEKPLIVTIRSHKYPKDIIEKLKKRPRTFLTVTTQPLKDEIPEAELIPNGIFEQFKPKHEFTVGWAGNPGMHREGYKGEDLIEQACNELGVKFKKATDIPFEEMPNFYQSLDCYVCASEAEGFSTDAMECLAMNIPVITTKVGIPGELNLIHVERSVEGIKKGIEKLYTQDQVKDFKWNNICNQYEKFYARVLCDRAYQQLQS